MEKEQKNLLIRIIVAAVFWVPLFLISEGLVPVRLPKAALIVLFLVPYLLVGFEVLREAAEGILHGEVFGEELLMTAATVGAIVLGEYGEGVAVMLLFQVGELFQDVAVGRSRRSITELMDVRPDAAVLETEDGEASARPEDVPVGSVIIVRPGEKIPLDGVILDGSAALDVSALTGESRPFEAGPGDAVLSGSVDLTGALRVRTTALFGDSTASRILDLAENAAERKSRSENFITRFARYYTPIVCGAALAIAVLPPLIMTLAGAGHAGLWREWILRACTLLVISCPCALVVSIPLGFFAGLGGASRRGILVKGSNFLEALSRVRAVAFDKTGTVTKGNFAVSAVHHSPLDDDSMLEFAALAECRSNHPISVSLREAAAVKPDPARVSGVEELSGLGVVARVDGREVAVGNGKLMARVGAEAIPCREPGTIVHMALDGAYCGHIVISDEVEPTAARAVEELGRAGVTRLVMLTGDTPKAAEKAAAEIGIADWRAGLLPDGKVACVEELLAQCSPREKLAFVGDGINDAPVLARADVGIAMGALGSDAAIEAADVVIMDDDPLKIAEAIRISRRCLRIVRENIVFAIAVKLVCLVLAALGLANMWAAIAADVGVMILAVLNAIRCLFVKKSPPRQE
ncbi:MAG: cadmium-translocating P-type ATPase [Oscillospiraceae bacterium]|nr:cadmium-translocating P-type ATPase [Oscillospiraceae bacterium]